MRKEVDESKLTIRPVSLSDTIDIYNGIENNREYLSEWLPFVPYTSSIEDTDAFVESVLNSPTDKIFYIAYDDQFVGLVGIKDIDEFNKRAEIGYWLIEDAQGKGIMTYAVETVLDFGYFALDLHRIQIKCAVGNTRSQAIPMRLGFTEEGIEVDGEKSGEHTWRDLVVYSLVNKE